MQKYFMAHGTPTLCVALALVAAPPVFASPVLRCQMLQGDTSVVREVVPSPSPYDFKPWDIRNRFRINAVVVGNAERVDYVKVYAYYYKRGRPTIAHMSHYPAPVVHADEHQTPLTGLQRIYSPVLVFELQYHCNLFDRRTGAAP